MKKAIGLDIGGTKIAAGVITEAGDLLHRVELTSDVSSRENMFKQVIRTINQVLTESGTSIDEIEGIGAGVPGKVDIKNGIAIFQNNIPWQKFPIVERLKDAFGINTVMMDNDVYMAAFAEWKAAQMKHNETFVYLTISTGISCSIIHNSQFLRGAGFAGELGLLPVLSKVNGSVNKRLEQAAAGPAIQKLAEKKLKEVGISTREVFAGYSHGVEGYSALIEEVAENLAQGIYAVACLIDPHKIVFGGSVIVNNPFLLEIIKEKLASSLIPEQKAILNQLFISRLAQNNGITGAGLRVFE